MLSLFAVPQLLGVLAYLRIKKYHDLLAHVAGVLIPPVSFFVLSQLMLDSSVREAATRDSTVCGTYLGMMALMILFATGVQILFSFLTQLALHIRHRKTTA